MKRLVLSFVSLLSIATCFASQAVADSLLDVRPEDKRWLLDDAPPFPAGNEPTPQRIALGKALFFDPRLSGPKTISCGSCHNPAKGWSDGKPVAVGWAGNPLSRATPSIVNAAYNTLQNWDGRHRTLEDQAIGPMLSEVEMHTNVDEMLAWLNSNKHYQQLFAEAYPGEAIDRSTLLKAIASFQRTVISNNSPFDRWVKGEKNAMTEQQIRGFRLFENSEKGNCAICHQPPNFTDNGFHNIGLKQYETSQADMGRYAIKPIAILRGAFKTPTLRDVSRTAPYFHDGSAPTLYDVMVHYRNGGESKKDLSRNMKPLALSDQEMKDIVAFMQALTSPAQPFTPPVLPPD